MPGNDIIKSYEALSRITGNMLLAAENGDWDSLTTLELSCRNTVRQLMAQIADVQLSESEQQRKLDIIRKILADDARIRELSEPRLSELLNLLRGTGTTRKLARTYENGSGG